MNSFASGTIISVWIVATIVLVVLVPTEYDPLVWIGSLLLAVFVRVLNRKADEAVATKKRAT